MATAALLPRRSGSNAGEASSGEEEPTEASTSCGKPGRADGRRCCACCCTRRCPAIALLTTLLLLLAVFGWVLPLVPYLHALPRGTYADVMCASVAIPRLKTPFGGALVCRPSSADTFPLHVFGHGDYLAADLYRPLLRQIASFGFVVAAYRSCLFSVSEMPVTQCRGGEATFMEVLRTIAFFMRNEQAQTVNLSHPVSVSGHSTGARAALMVAAVHDTPAYLNGTDYAADLDADGGELRRAASFVGAAIGYHPDSVTTPSINPDVRGFAITSTPVFVITSAWDLLEPEGSGWDDFMATDSPDKVFVSTATGDHLEPMSTHIAGPYLALFSQAFALGNRSAQALIYGTGPRAMRSVLPIAHRGTRNTGSCGGFVACGGGSNGSFAEPPDAAECCNG